MKHCCLCNLAWTQGTPGLTVTFLHSFSWLTPHLSLSTCLLNYNLTSHLHSRSSTVWHSSSLTSLHLHHMEETTMTYVCWGTT